MLRPPVGKFHGKSLSASGYLFGGKINSQADDHPEVTKYGGVQMKGRQSKVDELIKERRIAEICEIIKTDIRFQASQPRVGFTLKPRACSSAKRVSEHAPL